jgi:hypothetical protein
MKDQPNYSLAFKFYALKELIIYLFATISLFLSPTRIFGAGSVCRHDSPADTLIPHPNQLDSAGYCQAQEFDFELSLQH